MQAAKPQSQHHAKFPPGPTANMGAHHLAYLGNNYSTSPPQSAVFRADALNRTEGRAPLGRRKAPRVAIASFECQSKWIQRYSVRRSYLSNPKDGPAGL